MVLIHTEIDDTLGTTKPDPVAEVRVTFCAPKLAKRKMLPRGVRPRSARVIGGKRGGLTYEMLDELAKRSPPPQSWFDEG